MRVDGMIECVACSRTKLCAASEGVIWIQDRRTGEVKLTNDLWSSDQVPGIAGLTLSQTAIFAWCERHHRIHVYRFDGSLLCVFGSLGSALGQFYGSCGVCWAESDRTLFVADFTNSRVQVFRVYTDFRFEFLFSFDVLHAGGVVVTEEEVYVVQMRAPLLDVQVCARRDGTALRKLSLPVWTLEPMVAPDGHIFITNEEAPGPTQSGWLMRPDGSFPYHCTWQDNSRDAQRAYFACDPDGALFVSQSNGLVEHITSLPKHCKKKA